MKFKITVLPGDGIGPEVIVEALKVMDAAGARQGHEFDLRYGKMGGVAIDEAAAFVAGHSLGEYTALTAAGSIGLVDTARLLKLRGQSMQKVCTYATSYQIPSAATKCIQATHRRAVSGQKIQSSSPTRSGAASLFRRTLYTQKSSPGCA